MATLKEYFIKDLEGLGTQGERILTLSDGRPNISYLERMTSNTDAGVNYVGFFVPSGAFDEGMGRYLILQPTEVLQRARETVEVLTSHPVYDPEGLKPYDMPLSGRVYIYVDDYVSDEIRLSLKEFAAINGYQLQMRDSKYSAFLNETEAPWAFISHDSTDKAELAGPLANKLSSMMCPVWYDEYSIAVGQSIREAIDNGLRDAKKCVLILSPTFLANPGWTKSEFNAVMSKHIYAGGSIVFPVWHNVSRSQVFEYSPILADIKGVNSAVGIDEMARQLFIQLAKGTG